MSKFAEKIIASMVDENGHCGERGLSFKQFEIILDAMDLLDRDEQDAGCWKGDYKTIYFTSTDFTGNVGPYRVKINKHHHFRTGYSVVSIDLRPEGEYEAELEEERKLRELRDFSGSEWVSEPKKRMDFTLTLASVHEFDGYYGLTRIYEFADEQGNCIVWLTGNTVGCYDENGIWQYAEVGDKVTMRATVKEHKEYRGIRQTVINRPAIKSIAA